MIFFRLLLIAIMMCWTQAVRAEGFVIGIVAPQSERYAILGKQIIEGARVQIEGDKNIPVIIDEPCTNNSGAAIADALIMAKAQAAIGFLCSETLEGALPPLSAARIPVLTISSQSGVVMEDSLKNNWPFFRLAPAPQAEVAKIADIILSGWINAPLALIDDGTLRARELTDNIRNTLEGNGVRSVITDTFRPGMDRQTALIQRLKKAGVAHVFISGNRDDIAIIARDAKAGNASFEIMGGTGLQANPSELALAEGTRAVGLPDYALLPAGEAHADRLRAVGVEPEGYVLPAMAAASIMQSALSRVSQTQKSINDVLVGQDFATPIGTVSFGSNHELSENPFRLLEWRGHRFVLVDMEDR